MKTLSIRVLAAIFVFISVSEQQQQLNNIDGHGQFIQSLREQSINSPSHAARELSGQYGYEVSNGKLIIKPCATRRRAMPDNWGYPMQINDPLAFRSGYPIQNDRPSKSVNKAILVGQVPPENVGANQDKVSNPLANLLKPQTTTEPEPEQINDYELEANIEASEHMIKHNEAVPSHGDSETHSIPVKDEIGPTSKVTIFHPVHQAAVKEKNEATHKEVPAAPKYIEKVDDPNEFIHSKIRSPFGTDQPQQNLLPQNLGTIPQSNCVHSENLENTQGDVNNFATNSRRSMGEIAENLKGATHRVPASTMKRIQDQKRQEKVTDTSSSLSDDSNRYGYPSSLLPYSPGYLVASSPVSSLGGRVIDPTKGSGIALLKDSQLAIMESPRVCYACTTLNDPTCYYPQRGTTVKYCRPGHNSCLTKTVKSTLANDKELIVIRDCGELCDSGSTASLVVTNSCSICGGDLCNDSPVDSGAFSNAPLSALLVFIVTWIVKIAM